MAFIGIGSFNKYYTYIFILVLARFISDYLEGFNEKEYYNRPNEENFIEFASIFAYHALYRDLMYFFGAIICGIILYLIYRKNEKSNKNSLSIEKVNSMKHIMLGLKNDSSYLIIFIISFIYSLSIMLRTFLMSMKFDAGFWTLEILFIIYLSIKILKIKIGNHQKVTIFILSIILFAIQIINSLLPKTDHNCNDNEECLDKNLNDNNMYIYMEKKFGHYGYIFLILFLYIFDFIMRDYSWVKLKFLMDAKSIPVFKIMLSIGIIGCLLVIICFIIVSNAPCNIIENITKIDNKYLYKDTDKEIDFVRQVCGLIDYDDITNKMKLYYDHFVIYFKDYSNSNRLMLEIFIIPLYIFIYVSINLTQAMILKYLDSNAMLVNINFNYLFSRLISYIKNGASKEFLTVTEFILLELCEIVAILAYMIYIELIELKFCKLDYHLKKVIGDRGNRDTFLLLSENNGDDNENDNPNNNDKQNNNDNQNNDKDIKKQGINEKESKFVEMTDKNNLD